MQEDKSMTFPHSLTLDERQRLSVSGVSDIGSYDEETITAMTSVGELTIKGERLHIIKMSIENGEMMLEGEINSLSYSQLQRQGGFFSRLLR